MNDLAHGTQAISLILSLVGIVGWAAWARRNRDLWLYAVAPISWLLHVGIFYIAYFAVAGQAAPTFILWSAVVRLHGVLLVLGIGTGLWFEHVGLVRKGPIL